MFFRGDQLRPRRIVQGQFDLEGCNTGLQSRKVCIQPAQITHHRRLVSSGSMWESINKKSTLPLLPHEIELFTSPSLDTYNVEFGSSVVECPTLNRESPGSNHPLLLFRRLGIFVRPSSLNVSMTPGTRQW